MPKRTWTNADAVSVSHMVAVEGRTCVEIAKILGKSATTVRRMRQRGDELAGRVAKARSAPRHRTGALGAILARAVADLGRANDLLECDRVCALASFAILNTGVTNRAKATAWGKLEEARWNAVKAIEDDVALTQHYRDIASDAGMDAVT